VCGVSCVCVWGWFCPTTQDVSFFLLARGPFAWLGWGTWGMVSQTPILFRRRARHLLAAVSGVDIHGAPMRWAFLWQGWPFNPEPAHGTLPARPHGVPLPSILGTDVGEPLGLCRETKPGFFTREYSKVTVTLDCGAAFKGMVTPKHEQ
jgi:hypothetical protein